MRVFLMIDEHRPKHVANNIVHKCRKVSYYPCDGQRWVLLITRTCVYLSLAIVCYGQWLVDTVGGAAAGWRGLALSAGCMLWMQFWAVLL
jgi:hypothetical protein